MKVSALFLVASLASSQPTFGNLMEDMREPMFVDFAPEMRKPMFGSFVEEMRGPMLGDFARKMPEPRVGIFAEQMREPMFGKFAEEIPEPMFDNFAEEMQKMQRNMALRAQRPLQRMPSFVDARMMDMPIIQVQTAFGAGQVETFETREEQIFVNGVPEVETHKIHCKGRGCTETVVVEGPQAVASVEGPMPVPASLRGAAEKLAAQKSKPCNHMKMGSKHGSRPDHVGSPAAPVAGATTNLAPHPRSQWSASAAAMGSLAALALFVPAAALGFASRKYLRRSVAELEEPLAPQRHIAAQESKVPDEAQLVGKYVHRIYARASN